ncbi:MAG: YggS family pyridoxal phosphate-dependent enzyme [Moorellales bacterium]
MIDVRANLRRVREAIGRAAERSGRDPQAVKLVAVTKNVPVEAIRIALEEGVSALGENRVQEARAKVAAIGRVAEWHFIGHLQTNKVKYLADWVDLIHSLDRWRLAEELEKQGARHQRVWPVLLQVNLSPEADKYGLTVPEVRPFLERLIGCRHLRVLGLMTIAPPASDPKACRPFFRRLRLLAEELEAERWPGVEMRHLSMGMSGDFEVAVEEGATLVRVGTAIFGPRPV